MSIFVAITIVREFYKGAKRAHSWDGRTIGRSGRESDVAEYAPIRRLHCPLCALFCCLSAGRDRHSPPTRRPNEYRRYVEFREYTLRMEKLGSEDTANYSAQKASVSLYEYGKKVAVLHPERRVYKSGPEPQPTSEVAIYSTAKNDVYVVFAAATTDGRQAVIQVFYNPLTMWVWIGGIVLVIGTLIALLPNKKTVVRRRPEAEIKEEPKRVEAKVSSGDRDPKIQSTRRSRLLVLLCFLCS